MHDSPKMQKSPSDIYERCGVHFPELRMRPLHEWRLGIVIVVAVAGVLTTPGLWLLLLAVRGG